jgi:adenylate cyclase
MEASAVAMRRLTTIACFDVASYSRLVGADEEGTLGRLQLIWREVTGPLVERHGGRIVKTTGDGLLLEFASAVEAVRCALAVQRDMVARNATVADHDRIAFRIGINVGDVVAEDEDLLGDAVNIAARLEKLAEPGGICLSQAARDHIGDRVPIAFEDLGEQSLHNIARPVRCFRVAPNGEKLGRPPEPIPEFGNRPAVAVLPFENLSGDPAQEYFVDGLTEDVITALAYYRWFPVIARNSTFAYKRQTKSAIEIGRELGAAYLVQGTVRQAVQRVRITVQLIDAASGHHLWAERYDRELTDIFQLQDEITAQVVASVEPELQRSEERRVARKRPDSLDAWDCALRAQAFQHRMSRSGHVEARALLERALVIDPASSFAWSLLALCHYHEGILGWAGDRSAALQASFEAAQRAVESDDRDWLAHGLLGMSWLWLHRRFEAALDEEMRAVSLNPSAPLARHFLACILEFTGEPARAIPHLQAIHRLDPGYQFASLAVADEALCHLLLGEPETAATLAAKAVQRQPANVRARQRLVAALAVLGRDDEARVAMAELLRLQPDLSIAYIDATYPFAIARERELFLAALRRAGLPQ